MKTLRTVFFSAAAIIVFVTSNLTAMGQTPIQLFGPTFVRGSATGASTASPVIFNSATVSLTCTGAISAKLSSTPNGQGNVLADNFIQVTVTAGSNKTGPTNVCGGGTSEAGQNGTQLNCFNSTYQNAAPNLLGVNLDTGTFTATGGVMPIDISRLFVAGTQQATVELVDTGSLLTNASLYLVTSCTQDGVTGPATVTGNPIPAVNPPPSLLVQDFDFDTTPGQGLGFTYDISTSQQNGQLQLTDNTIPNAADMPLDPTLWQTQYAKGTSFATSSCLIHRGELLNGQSACKLYTLTCQVGTGTTSAGALCPVSKLRDEIFSDKFTGPAFPLPDITGPTGRTFHQGVGLLMAAEGWKGGPCTFDPASGLQASDCPQNLLTFFNSPGISAPTPSPTPQVHSLALASAAFSSGGDDSEDEDMDFDGSGTHPNSTFVTVSGVPEDLTTVIVVGQFKGGWVNTHNVRLWMWSEPPVLPHSVPNHQNFVASPIQSITYGIAPAGTMLSTKFAIPGDVTLTDSNGCPSPAHANQRPASVFAPPTQTIHVKADGQYLLHYFAQDCAGTEELKFSAVGNGGWATSFFSVPVNVDTVDPKVTQGPTLSAPKKGNSSYALHEKVTASYSCSDDASGVAICGDKFYGSPGTLNTGVLTSTIDTSRPGTKTFTVWTIDIAGNIGEPQSVKYTVK
jgi:hypothetical protein